MVQAAPHVRPRTARLWLHWGIAAALLAADLIVAASATYICQTPVDFVGATSRLPGGTSLARENTSLFLAHQLIAQAMDAAGCSPTAAGVQWIKAAAHTVRSDRSQAVIDGLRGEEQRSASQKELAAELCSYLRSGSAVARQEQELAAAGLPCPSVFILIRP